MRRQVPQGSSRASKWGSGRLENRAATVSWGRLSWEFLMCEDLYLRPGEATKRSTGPRTTGDLDCARSATKPYRDFAENRFFRVSFRGLRDANRCNRNQVNQIANFDL